jgi:hypothetical protein
MADLTSDQRNYYASRFELYISQCANFEDAQAWAIEDLEKKLSEKAWQDPAIPVDLSHKEERDEGDRNDRNRGIQGTDLQHHPERF